MGGGGESSPTVVSNAGAGYGGASYCSSTTSSITKSTAVTADVTHSHHHRPLLTGISREPFRPFSSGEVGLSCLCPVEPDEVYSETLDCSRMPYSTTCVFGPPPSRMEVETAMADLQRAMHDEVSSGMHWLHPILLNPGYARFHNAFYMLQREPTVQNMVVNISSDKAFWDAIMNNRAVQNLQNSISAEQKAQAATSEEADIANLILKWILGITKSKIMDVIEKIGVLMIELFVPGQKDKPTSELTDLVEEKIRFSLLLSVVILLIVVITRNNGA